MPSLMKSNESLSFEQSVFEKLKEAEQEARTTDKRFSLAEVHSALSAIIQQES